MSCANPAEPIKIPLVVWTLEGQSNHVLSGSPDPPGEGPILGSSAETAGPIEMPFGVWTWVASKNHVLVGVRLPLGKGAILGEKATPGDAAVRPNSLTTCSRPPGSRDLYHLAAAVQRGVAAAQRTVIGRHRVTT